MIRYSRINLLNLSSFTDKALLLSRKILNQRFNNRHHDLIICYGISVSQMITDVLSVTVYLCHRWSRGYYLLRYICVTDDHGGIICYGTSVSQMITEVLSVTVYLCHRWSRMYSICLSHNPVLFTLVSPNV